jgi:hypothetical protein
MLGDTFALTIYIDLLLKIKFAQMQTLENIKFNAILTVKSIILLQWIH